MANRAVVTWVQFEVPSAQGAVTVVPALQTMTLSLHAPTVSATRSVTVTPSLLTMTLTLRGLAGGGGAARRRGRFTLLGRFGWRM